MYTIWITTSAFFCLFCWWNCLICHACILLQFAVAFCGLGFISLYLAGKLHCFQAQGRGQGWKLCIALTPLIAAMALVLTRYSDYRHHWQGILDRRKVTSSGSPGLMDNYFIIHTGKSWKLSKKKGIMALKSKSTVNFK